MEQYDKLCKLVERYHPSKNIEILQRAYEVAKNAHQNQRRKFGEPYIIHPLEVACILAALRLDRESIAAALLHDVIEDSPVTLEELERAGFPDKVLGALRALTHDPKVPYMEYVAALRNDPIAAAVKLADLRHNSDLSRLDRVDERALARAEKYRKAIALLCGEEG